MIHACTDRMWYVEKYLIPSMLEQGIPRDEITVWNDADKKGNLVSCMEAFRECGKRDGGTWHLQDDVLICRDFAQRTKENEDGVVCGFMCRYFQTNLTSYGKHSIRRMWYSFQCIRIPNELAGECAEWFFSEAINDKEYEPKIKTKKFDDWFWLEFMKLHHNDMKVMNLKPNLVDHVDYLIGGSVVNKERTRRESRAFYFEDQDLVTKLGEQLRRR